jgi:hypothetical protein
VLDRENFGVQALTIGMAAAVKAIHEGRFDRERGELFLQYLYDEGYIEDLEAREMHVHSHAYNQGITVYESVG